MASVGDTLFQPFTDFFTQPSREKLSSLLRNNVGEFDHFDFKTELILGSKLARDILAFANSTGGAIVFGVAEDDDRSLDPKGLAGPKDKAEIVRSVRRFLPDSIKFYVLDFAYTESTPAELSGKTFQVLLVPDDATQLPFVSKADGDGITQGSVYVRDGTESRTATHTQLQQLINRRLGTGHSTSRELSLKEHLDELEILFNKIPERIGGGSLLSVAVAQAIRGAMMEPGTPNPDYPKESLAQFLNRAVEVKKKVIIDFLRGKK